MNYNAEFGNGSPELDQVRRLGGQIQAREAHRVGLANLLKTLVEEVGNRIARLQRLLDQARGHAALAVLRSSNDRAIHLARGYHGLAGSADELIPPRLDLSGLELAERQAGEFTRQWKHLESLTTTVVADGDRIKAIVGVSAALAGTPDTTALTQGLTPALTKQYASYAKQVRLPETAREISKSLRRASAAAKK